MSHPIPVHQLVPLLGTAITLRSFAASTINAHGESVSGAASDTPIFAAVHPATAQMLQRLPEADRLRETIAVYSTEPVRSVTALRPNHVVYQGVAYEVTEVQDYDALGGMYITLAQRIEATA